MLLKNFYRKLNNLTEKNNVVWRMDRTGKIRCTINSRVYCPIAAVINIDLGKRVNVTDAIDYSDLIGLDYVDACIIACASDQPSNVLNSHEKHARAALLRATNLS